MDPNIYQGFVVLEFIFFQKPAPFAMDLFVFAEPNTFGI